MHGSMCGNAGADSCLGVESTGAHPFGYRHARFVHRFAPLHKLSPPMERCLPTAFPLLPRARAHSALLGTFDCSWNPPLCLPQSATHRLPFEQRGEESVALACISPRSGRTPLPQRAPARKTAGRSLRPHWKRTPCTGPTHCLASLASLHCTGVSCKARRRKNLQRLTRCVWPMHARASTYTLTHALMCMCHVRYACVHTRARILARAHSPKLQEWRAAHLRQKATWPTHAWHGQDPTLSHCGNFMPVLCV